MIDSFNFPQEARSVAELCFDLLSDRMIHKRRVAILVACNKQDLALVSGRDYIKKRLEAEMLVVCVIIMASHMYTYAHMHTALLSRPLELLN